MSQGREEGVFPGLPPGTKIPRARMERQLHICPHLLEGWCRDCVQSNIEAWSSRIESDIKVGLEPALIEFRDKAIHDVHRAYAGALDAINLKIKKARQEEMRAPAIVDHLISNLPKEWLRFCTAEVCACMGCVNGCRGITHEEWEDWKKRHGYCEHCKRREK